VIAGSGSDMQRDYASHSVRHYEDLDDAETLGRTAGERTVRRLNPAKIASGVMPVVFDPRVGGSLVGHLLSAITGSAIARKTSFLLGREQEQIFPEAITIRDNPHKRRGLRSKSFDGEGVATRASDLVAGGRLTGWMTDSASARQLGLQPTGHASRGVGGPPGASATNVDLLAGGLSREELIADIKRGLYVTELIGQGVNPVTGDYSRGASGFIVENGEITAPVAEITIAGNLIEMFRTLVAANDLQQRRALNVPTIRVEGLTIAGA
jgi:PmbA protein